MKTNVMSIASGCRKELMKKSPQILTGLGIVGMISATVLAVKATTKAISLRNIKLQEVEEEKLAPIDVIKACWRPYVPSISLTVLSTICLVGANRISTGRIAVLTTAYKISETALIDFKNAVKETVNEEQKKDIKETYNKKVIERAEKQPDQISGGSSITPHTGNYKCLDTLSGQEFESNKNELDRIINVLNKRLNKEMYISLNDFYVEAGLRTTKLGQYLGWCCDQDDLELDYDSGITIDGVPYLVIDFNVMPQYDYSKIY